MEERNPYAAPQAPVIAADEPTRLPSDPELFEYGSFWRRVGALLLDSLFLSPLGILVFVLLNYTSRAYVYFAVPSIAISLVYYVWLVKRYGGTPGKLITKMRVTMTDGSPVTTKAAFMRYAPLLVLHLLGLVVTIQATSHLTGFDSMSYLEKMQALGSNAPRGLNTFNTVLTWVWWIGTAITMVANRRRRAAHDFLAGTVVLRTD
jgi:uncharacterized RDD family membrane protein YckC